MFIALHHQNKLTIIILQLSKEVLPKTTQQGSGRVETEFRLEVHLKAGS